MANFSLGKHPHVELCDLLKLEGWSESGAQAKIAIADGLVKVDGAVETRKHFRLIPLLPDERYSRWPGTYAGEIRTALRFLA